MHHDRLRLHHHLRRAHHHHLRHEHLAWWKDGALAAARHRGIKSEGRLAEPNDLRPRCHDDIQAVTCQDDKDT
jgi:hypothetical protein